MKAVMKEE